MTSQNLISELINARDALGQIDTCAVKLHDRLRGEDSKQAVLDIFTLAKKTGIRIANTIAGADGPMEQIQTVGLSTANDAARHAWFIYNVLNLLYSAMPEDTDPQFIAPKSTVLALADLASDLAHALSASPVRLLGGRHSWEGAEHE